MYKAVEQCMSGVCVCNVSVHVKLKTKKNKKNGARTLVWWQAESLYIQSSLVNKMWLWAKKKKTGNQHLQRITDETQNDAPIAEKYDPSITLIGQQKYFLPLKSWGIKD